MAAGKAPARKAATKRANCGTLKGHRAHGVHGEFSCNACLDAHAENVMANKVLRGDQDRIQIEVVTIGLMLLCIKESDPDSYEVMRAHIRPKVADACIARAESDL